ncbi:MAG: hypothetical protein GKC06_00120 [Methanomicrobiales archaeon]|nr:hypothetical protein [Methanomicrobiales archaeon]
MPEDISDLIEKINQEGIRAAEEKARLIESAAQQKADAILNQAKIEVEEMISAAHERIRREDERERALLAQAGRDLLLTLREEINAMLKRIVVADTRQALTPEVISGLLTELIRNYSTAERTEVIVMVNGNDLELLEKHYLNRLRKETERDISLRQRGDIQGGFTISFDGGRSSYDFSDRALAEYIVSCLKPKLKKILQGEVED